MDEARIAAVELVFSVTENRSFSNLLLEKIFDSKNMTRLDRAFATAIGYGTITFIINIDRILTDYSSIQIKKVEPKVLAILRTAIWQIFWSDTIPDHAVCNESVQMTKGFANKGAISYVNGILRKIIRDKEDIRQRFIDSPRDFYLKCAMPKEIAGYFAKWYGKERAILICKAMNRPPRISGRVNTRKTTIESLSIKLQEAGCVIGESSFVENAFSIRTNGIVLGSIEAFRDGEFVIQDEASMMAGYIADPRSGQRVVDLCSAPGGKTCHMAELMNDIGEITACDINESRLELVKQNAEKTGCSIIKYKVSDAQEPFDEIEYADVVLADVPCSGLGIMSKKPDIRLNMTHERMLALYPIQKAILDNAAKAVKPGGYLVYSTCTINPAENQLRIQKFLEENANSFESVDITPYLPKRLTDRDPGLLADARHGMLSLYPDTHDCDGFFISKLRRKSK